MTARIVHCWGNSVAEVGKGFESKVSLTEKSSLLSSQNLLPSLKFQKRLFQLVTKCGQNFTRIILSTKKVSAPNFFQNMTSVKICSLKMMTPVSIVAST